MFVCACVRACVLTEKGVFNSVILLNIAICLVLNVDICKNRLSLLNVLLRGLPS